MFTFEMFRMHLITIVEIVDFITAERATTPAKVVEAGERAIQRLKDARKDFWSGEINFNSIGVTDIDSEKCKVAIEATSPVVVANIALLIGEVVITLPFKFQGEGYIGVIDPIRGLAEWQTIDQEHNKMLQKVIENGAKESMDEDEAEWESCGDEDKEENEEEDIFMKLTCPHCGTYNPVPFGHHPDCPWQGRRMIKL